MAIEKADIIQQIYRKEFSRMVAVLSKLFGLDCIELAEDIVSATFAEAVERWHRDGVPVHPAAWLYKVARNKALYHFRRSKVYARKLNDIRSGSAQADDAFPEPDFSSVNSFDSQLKMLFAVCDPAIASEAQIGLALRILCGFTIEEIARAFFTNKETINKRLFRAKEKIRDSNLKMEMPPDEEINRRLGNVLHIIYLLFNEGYYSSSSDAILRKNLCAEALSLALTLREHPKTNTPNTNALIALMCFHSSRIEARLSSSNEPILYDDQDSAQWDTALIEKGMFYLQEAARGNELSSYHLEAGIAFLNSQPGDDREKWEQILRHYDLLLQINYTPSTVLNRVYALYKTEGSAAALNALAHVPSMDNHFYYTLLGKLHEESDAERSSGYYLKAIQCCKTSGEKRIIEAKLHRLRDGAAPPKQTGGSGEPDSLG